MPLIQGNDKLGPAIFGWSTPAITTCPGRSPVCEAICYALRGRYHLPSVKLSLQRNLESSKRRDFIAWMNHELSRNCVQLCRIGVSGDFYSESYVAKWHKIVTMNRRTHFFAYTRSWNVPDIKPSIMALSREPNMTMWLSFDRSMRVPPRTRWTQICYLASHDLDFAPCAVGLVFRDNPSEPMKYDPLGNLVCPYDNLITPNITCSKCGICFLRKERQRGARQTVTAG